MPRQAVVLWDEPGDPRCGPEQRVLCWQNYAKDRLLDSVPGYLEEHARDIRAKYLGFIHALGEYRVAGRRVVDHLERGDGFSLWWMSLVAEKNPFKSPAIYDCLRLLALEEMLAGDPPSELTLVSSNRDLSAAVGQLCRSLSIAYRWRRRPAARRDGSLRRLYSVLPSPVQGMLSLRHVVLRWRLRSLRSVAWFSGPEAAFVCSYFIHLDPSQSAQGSFDSRQWGALPGLLRERGTRTNWLQLFLVSSIVPDTESGIGWAQAFNRDAGNQGSHRFLDSYLTWRTVLSALRLWWWLNRVRWRLSAIAPAFQVPGSKLSLWPLLRKDWLSSLSGPSGMSNCLCVALFDRALAAAPHQPLGLYLYENQPWEMALLRAWRRHSHGHIIGVQHSTTPFWYLPHSVDAHSGEGCPAPLPDRLAVNGAAARSAFLGAGVPGARLADVEALRYLELEGMAGRRELRSRPQPGTGPARTDRARKVLVLGDIAPPSTHRLLKLLDGAFPRLAGLFELTFKPHPGYAVDLSSYRRLQVVRTDRALGALLADYDLVIAANGTSAAADAYVAGLPVIIGLHGDTLNMSPLRGRPGVHFVTTPEELIEALRVAPGTGAERQELLEFFYLDRSLRRWRRLLDGAIGDVDRPSGVENAAARA